MRTLAEANAIYETNSMMRDAFKAGALLAITTTKTDAILKAEQTKGLPPRVLAMLRQKANPTVIDPASGEHGMEAQLGTAVLGSLSNVGAFDAMLPFAQQYPPNTRVSVIIGLATGQLAEQGALKVLSQLEVSAERMRDRKIVAVIAATDELMRLAVTGGVPALVQALRVSLARATDLAFISEMSSILTPIASQGRFIADLRVASQAIATGSTSRLWAIVSSSTAKKIAFAEGVDGQLLHPGVTIGGGQIGGVQVLVVDSNVLADDEMLVLDSQSILAWGGTVIMDRATQAVLDMDGLSSMISLWQRGMVGLRAERIGLAFEPARSGFGALINSISYESGS